MKLPQVWASHTCLLCLFKTLSRYSRAVRPPPQDSEKNEEGRWRITAGMCPIGQAFHQWGVKKTHTDGSFTLLPMNSEII
ncbi:hypothetical protein COE51_12010 [Bacillus pseudomycoides]|nr:hypothetical protein COE51_12010 [Bacillus pseudomycoides]